MVYCAEASGRPPVCPHVSGFTVLPSAALRPSLEPRGSLLPDLGQCLTLSRPRGITGDRGAVDEGAGPPVLARRGPLRHPKTAQLRPQQ